MKLYTYKKEGLTHTIGIYAIKHAPSGYMYIGGSTYSIEGRFSHHKAQLKAGLHSCQPLQKKWGETKLSEWTFSILESCPKDRVKARETYWIRCSNKLLNVRPGPLDRYTHTEATKQKLSASAKRVGSSKAERKRRSERAKKQHQAGNFGRATWSRATEEQVGAKISKALKGRPGRKGWKHTISHRRHISRLMSGSKNHRYGVKASEATRAKMRLAQQIRWQKERAS